jgi:hypothetical protein
VRTLHAAHRTLVSQLLGAPLRPGALRDYGADLTASTGAGERGRGEAAPAERAAGEGSPESAGSPGDHPASS